MMGWLVSVGPVKGICKYLKEFLVVSLIWNSSAEQHISSLIIHASNPRTLEAEVGGSLQVQDRPGLHRS